jgi:poly-beta-1,6-N-acetyl-D-glucosamine synthase
VIMRVLFWTSLLAVVYVYLLYPVLISAWAACRRHTDLPTLRHLPAVSIVIAARNEAQRLPGRIRNLLALHYPPERVEIIVVSDGSTDGTAAALAPFGPRVRLIEVPAGGKAAALNAGCAAARHDVLVFADARQRFAADALRWLVAPLADPSVGGVTGELILDCERRADSTTVGESMGAYWRYEKWLRRRESEVWSTLGATGCIYALRRTLWTPLPPGTLLDDVLAPMRAVLAGFRIVFDPRARAFDSLSPDTAAESRRKVRTLAGNFQILAFEPRLLVPIVNPVWLQYVSHKIGRLLVPYAMASLLVASIWLAPSHLLYATALAGQVALYGLAVYGAVLERRETAHRPTPRPATRDAVERPALRPGRVRSHA